MVKKKMLVIFVVILIYFLTVIAGGQKKQASSVILLVSMADETGNLPEQTSGHLWAPEENCDLRIRL